MKINYSSRRNCALTLLEVLVVLFIIFILAAIFLPPTHTSGSKSRQISCVNNLKQVGLSFHLWEGDNAGKYPMDVSVTNGGTMELSVNANDAWKTFLVMSNQLSTPKILFCPADIGHTIAVDFSANFSAKNISYFIGLDATESNPQMFLSGDDNFAVSGVPVKSGLLELSTNTPIAWTAARHRKQGDIVLADGSVQELTELGLTNLLSQTGLATNRLVIP